MQLDSLKLFCDIVRLQSFSDAAQENAVTQAAASQTVQQLERKFAVQLIDRSTRPFRLTEEGTFFYEGCRDIIFRYSMLEDEMNSRRGAISGKVKLAAIYSAGIGDISKSVEDFTRLYPGSSVELSYLHPNKVTQTVLNGESDLGIISYPKITPELDSVSWKEEKLVLVYGSKHWLAAKDRVHFKAVDGEKFVAFDRELTIRKEIDRFLKTVGVSVDVCMSFDNIETIKRAVEDGEGVSILPDSTVRNELSAGSLQAIQLPKPGLTRPLGIIFKKNRKFFHAADRFVDVLLGQSRIEKRKVA